MSDPPKSIILTFTNVSWSKGAAAQVISFLSELDHVRDDVHVMLVSHCEELDREPAGRLGMGTVGCRARPDASRDWRGLQLLFARMQIAAVGMLKHIGIQMGTGTRAPVAGAYANADLLLDMSGDSYRDRPGGVSIAHNANLLAARASGIPYSLVSQSIGPFRPYNVPLTRYCLNGAELIYIRETITRDLLLDLGVDPDRILLAPDVAFVLPAAGAAEVGGIFESEGLVPDDLPRPWIGISVSHLCMRLDPNSGPGGYVAQMARVSAHIHEHIGASVFLVSHQVNPPQSGRDDRHVASIIAGRLGHPSWLKIFAGDYDPCELKGIIAGFDAFLGARMHAAIAALSSGVPTIAIAWAHKYDGMMTQIGIPELVWNIRGDARDLPAMFDDLWRRRDELRSRLVEYTESSRPGIREAVRRVTSSLDV